MEQEMSFLMNAKKEELKKSGEKLKVGRGKLNLLKERLAKFLNLEGKNSEPQLYKMHLKNAIISGNIAISKNKFKQGLENIIGNNILKIVYYIQVCLGQYVHSKPTDVYVTDLIKNNSQGPKAINNSRSIRNL